MSDLPPPYWQRLASQGIRQVRRIIVAVIGGTVLLIGIVMIVTPLPGILVMPVGLAILSTEFLWARRLLTWAKAYIASKRPGANSECKPPQLPR